MAIKVEGEMIEGRFNGEDLCFSFRNVPLEDWRLKEGWRVEKDAEVQEGEFAFELVSFCKDGKSCISGEELEKRAQEQDCCQWGFRHAKQILEKQDRIPKWMREYYLVFPDSVWLNPDGYRRMPSLCWDGGGWSLGFHWLRDDFYSYGRFVRPCK